MHSAALSAEQTVADVMQRSPAALRVFVTRRMACPGCPLAPFMTVRDAAEAYGFTAEALLEELMAAAAPSEDEVCDD